MSQQEKTSNFKTGAVRSADANHLDFTSLPLVGLIGVARTAAEGGTKYGRYNYMQGMPVHDTLNHSIRHILMYLLGDRSEPHLEHSAWGLLASIQQETLNPSVSAPHLLGPGATITPAVQAYLDANKEDLAARRKAGEFAGIGDWNLRDLPEIQTILKQRDAEEAKEENIGTPRRPWNEVIRGALKEYARNHSQTHGKPAAVVDPNITEERFRVKHPSSGETRICKGKIHCNNRSVKPGSRDFASVLIVDRDEQMYALMSQELCNEQVLVVQKEDWDAGEPFSIDSNWGWASASARSSKITEEVTRTEPIHGGQGEPGDPLPDESYVDFLMDAVRVYFKKS